ncbi:MAG TPA: hypothetical protein VME66_11690 [Candidatus Acidoferrales bacterium]|nr:hypothetical protein [Candidatus Acidoferrales bacterium]
MKAFGYTVSDADAKQPQQFRELTLLLSLQEMELVVECLQHAKAHFERGAPKAGEAHVHLRDWWKGWSSAEPDLVIVFEHA